MLPFPPTADEFIPILATRNDALILYTFCGYVLRFQHQFHEHFKHLDPESSEEAERSRALIYGYSQDAIDYYLSITPDEYRMLTPDTIVEWYPTKGTYYGLPLPKLLDSLAHSLGRTIEISLDGFVQGFNGAMAMANPIIYEAIRHDIYTMHELLNMVRIYVGRNPVLPPSDHPQFQRSQNP